MNALMIAYFVVLGSVDCVAGKTVEDSGQYICAIRYVFPTFAHFVIGAVVIGAPLLITVGYFHYQKNQYGTHAHVNWRTNPYQKITLSILLELVSEVKLQNKFNDGKVKRLEDLENKLIDLLEDKRLTDKPPGKDNFSDF